MWALTVVVVFKSAFQVFGEARVEPIRIIYRLKDVDVIIIDYISLGFGRHF